jgi:O-antigen ligase
MFETAPKGLTVLLAGGVAATLALFLRPGYLSDYTVLGALLGAEVLLLATCKYRQAFFPLLMAAFVISGADLPGQSVFLYARWLVLAAGALIGVAVYLRNRNHFFSAFHAIALFCVISAIVSASVSAYPEEALLKAASLALLFLYASTGARAALPTFTPELFFRKLLTACEILTILTAIAYFALRWQYLGNPNSLGAVMGVAVMPILLWGLITADGKRRFRLGFELLLAALLLMSSFARAGICAAAVSALFLCFALKQYRLLMKCAATGVVVAVAVATLIPRSNDLPQTNGSEPISDVFLYKGHADAGVLGSRRGVWAQTWDVISENPWFGSGFGTSTVTTDVRNLDFRTGHTNSRVIREHGNSYLAITEWEGLLGVVPFVFLLLLSLNNLRKVFSCAQQTGDGLSPALPAAAVVLAGIVHASFEDWMFAVGYYLCIFFWVIAFILVDLLPGRAVVLQPRTMVVPALDRNLSVASGQ